jgi:hypothetical protein
MIAFPVFGMLLACVIAFVMWSRPEVISGTATDEQLVPTKATQKPVEIYRKAA